MDPTDWNTNFWDAGVPTVHAPAPRARAPKPVPEEEQLFQVQRNAQKTLVQLQELQALVDDHKANRVLASAIRDAENAYRVIRTYLKEHVNPWGA